jgi:ADP-ribosyl-[dinitrogen reductase] hydrolase
MIKKAIGSMIGGAIGDSIGFPYEIFPKTTNLIDVHQMVLTQRKNIIINPEQPFESGGPWSSIGMSLPAGSWTDDTAMMLCLSDSIMTCKTVDISDLMIRFRKWWSSGYNSCTGFAVGLGGNIRKAICSFDEDNPYKLLGGTNPDTDSGNGSLMRLAPCCVYWSNDIALAKAIEMVKLQTATTHNTPEALDTSCIMTFIIWHGINNFTKEQIFKKLYECYIYITNIHCKALISENASWRFKRADQIYTLPGRALWSLEAALWCVFHTNNFTEAIIRAVSLGGDADTIGSITGQIAGALYGVDNIPATWIEKVKHHKQIIQRAKALYLHEKYNKKTMDLIWH